MKISLVAIALLVATTSAARADESAKKLASLDVKKQSIPAPQTKRQKFEAQLAKRIGQPPEEVINIRNTWTNETLVLSPQQGTDLDQATLDAFFRCHFTNQRPHFDRRLLGVLAQAAQKFKAQSIQIVSGFRAPKYNLVLRKKGREVARNSQHTDGNAVDFRIPGVTTRQLHAFVKSLRLGGVGLYLESAFVHADVGPIRYWNGR